jgi:cobalt-zinc-cadmium efflux system membrane fusion protein
MNRNQISIFLIIVITIALSIWILIGQDEHHDSHDGHGHGHDEHEEAMPRGPHGGQMLEENGFQLEMTIFESGVPPELHIYPYLNGQPVEPSKVDLTIKLHRTGNKTDAINFQPQQDYLQGDQVIYEPHSFEVEVMAKHAGKTYHWRYDNFEGRTQIPEATAKVMGIETEKVGPVTLQRTLTLSGQVHTNPNHLAQVRPRFAGIVTAIKTELGQQVKKGEVLARVQSNESLQTYSVKAPIDGLVVQRNIQIGEATGDEPLFVIVDLSSVWVELDVFSRDLDKVKVGQITIIETLDGKYSISDRINWISPLTVHGSQSVRARIPVDNADGSLRPGQYIRGYVVIDREEVKLAVRLSAIQKFRDFDVVFAKFGDTYEVRMLELGKRNKQWVEVLSGIEPGSEYVTKNSYLIKADIEKSGASHAH